MTGAVGGRGPGRRRVLARLTPEALQAAAELRSDRVGYREIATRLYRRGLVPAPVGAQTVWLRLHEAGLGKRCRRKVAR